VLLVRDATGVLGVLGVLAYPSSNLMT
jgi:hypothetical protein